MNADLPKTVPEVVAPRLVRWWVPRDFQMRNHNDKLHEDIRVSGKLITESLGKLIRAAGDGLQFDPRRELEIAAYHWNKLQSRVREWVKTEEEKAAESACDAAETDCSDLFKTENQS